MTGWWVHDVFNGMGGGGAGAAAVLGWVFWVLASITLHELGHGWAAIWQGDRTPIETGHMSASPLVHMGGMSLIVFAFIGIAWGLMPVNPSRFRHHRWGRVMVAAAGPAMNLLLFLVIATLLGVLIGTGAIHLEEVGFGKNVAYFLVNGAMLNLLLLAFNLLPVPPLDGWRILEGVSFKARMLTNHPNAPIAGLFFLMAIFLTGAFDWFVVAANYAAMNWAAMVAGMFAG